MSSIIKRIFGHENVVNTALRGADKLVFTQEERSEFWLRMMAAYEPFKIAQRLLALAMTIPFVLINFLCAMLEVGFVLGDVPMSVQPIMEMNNETLGIPVMWVMIFYFGGGAAEGGARGMMAALTAYKKANTKQGD